MPRSSSACIHLPPRVGSARPCTAAPRPTAPCPPQVRHYYYRLIKRLNKILGSDAKLDIKNPLQVGAESWAGWTFSGCGKGRGKAGVGDCC